MTSRYCSHHTRMWTTDSRSVRGSGARTAALGETGQDSSSAGVAGADRATDGRRQERHGGSRATWHDPRDRGQVAAAVSARRLRWLAGRAAPGSAAHDRGRRRGAGGGANLAIPAGATHWSTRSMAKACGLSAATVSRIWRAFGLKPHRCETFKLSRDPLFIEKVRDVGCTCIRPSARWCCAWTRSRSKRRSQPVLPMVQASQSGAPTTTAGTEPPRCLRPWT